MRPAGLIPIVLHLAMANGARADQSHRIRLPHVVEGCSQGTLDIDLALPSLSSYPEDSPSSRRPLCKPVHVQAGSTDAIVLPGSQRSFPLCLGEGGSTTIIWQGIPLLVQLAPAGKLKYIYGPYCELLPNIPAIAPTTASPKFTRCIGKRSRCPQGFTRPPRIYGDGKLCVAAPKRVPCVADGQLRFRSERAESIELESAAGDVKELRLTAGVATQYFPIFFMDSYDGIWEFRIQGTRYFVLMGFGQRWTVNIGGDGTTVSVKVEDW